MRTQTNNHSVEQPPAATQQTKTDNETNNTTYKVIRRNGKLTAFSADKIAIAMTKAFLDVEGKRSAASTSIRDKVTHLTQEVVNALFRCAPKGGIVHIEDIQDHVELALMRSGEHKIARSYVLYREQRAQQRAKKEKKAHKNDKPTIIHITTATGEQKPLDKQRLQAVIEESTTGLKNVDTKRILKGVLRNLFDGIPESDVGSALVMSARTLIDQDPEYSYVSARLLLDNMRTEALSFTYGHPRECTQQELGTCYVEYFGKYIKKAVELQHLDEELTRYDLKKLGAALQPERDLNFTYLGLQTLYDRYFIHHEHTRFELPQAFFMRVAMGLAINEIHREERAIEFYQLLSSFRFMSSTPTLFNSGGLRPQLSSCYLTTVPDDLAGIYDAIKDNALLSKFAGGLGNDWTPVRGLGSHIKGTNGQSQGVVPFLKVVNDTAVAVNQGGKRKGAVCAYLETWHIDIEEFLELRKNTGDERRRTHDMNTANWIPDLMMKRVAAEQDWTLFSPDETPDLHDLYGRAFEKRYLEYEAKAARGEIRLSRTVKAVELWRKMLGMIFETGHPWLCFSGDTKVAVADGREPIEIKELAESTKTFPVYSARPVSQNALNFNNTNQRHWTEEIKIATAFKSGTRTLVSVHLDDGSSFRCTEDHLLALKDGGYVRADESAGLSLCPFNRWQDNIRPNNRYIGRNKDPRQRQANMIWNFYNGDIPKGYVVDHIQNGAGDFIANLQLLTVEEHNKKTALERIGENNPFYGKTHSEKARKKISENTKRFMTEEYKQHLSNKLKGKKKPDRYGLSNPELITKGREFYNKYNTLSNKSWRKHYKIEGLPSAGYIANRFKYWSDFTDSCINNHKVIKVENTGKTEDVYDLSVEDNHNFFIVTNETDSFKSGVLVHNCFKDPCNVRYSNQHVGVVHSSNLCTEISLHTNADEIAVCFPKGTQILTQNGQKPIELCDQEQVLVPFNNDLIPQQRFLTATLIPQGKKQVYELITKNGITICATEEHPFLIQQAINNDKPIVYEWRKLKELEKGDFIVCPLNTPIYDNDIGQQDADFTAAGWMLGDGWMSTSYGACFAPHETTAQDFVLPILERWHQESPLGNNTPHSAPPTPYVQPNGVINWHTQRKGFIDYVHERFGFHPAKGPEKHIAPQIKQASVNQIASFLSGLFSADGCVLNDSRRKKGGVAVNLSSASLQLLCDVQLLLKPFGIHGRIRGCSVKGRESKWQGTYEIKSRDSVLNFTRFIGFSLTPNKQEKLQGLLTKLSSKSAFQHSAVVDIIAKGEEEVFDLSLTEDHSFIANGLVVHNCNLGSVNLAAHTTKDGLDMPLLEKTITTATRMLDNVIEYNYYSVPQARRSNLQHRPVGLGLMGFQDALYKLNIPYATEAAVEFADRSMEAISYFAIQGSNKLAEERGKYSTYEGSLWSRGILPIDSLELMEQERGEFFQVDKSKTLDWDKLKDKIKQHGMRNSNVMAIAPTATISNICGVSQSIEPTYQNMYVKSNLSGEFTVVNPYLINELKALNLWDDVMINDLKYFDGSVQKIDRVPKEIKEKYATAFEIDSRWLIEAASRRQKWIDQGESLNLYLAEPSGKKLDDLYKLAWIRGLKTTYYLRTLGATHMEKSADATQTNAAIEAPKVCSILDPDCEACQ